jgi:acetylornithine deacetylase
VDHREDKLIAAVDGLCADMIAFAMRLVAQPSTRGNEAGVLAQMENELDCLGFVPFKVPIDPAVLSDHPGFAPVPWPYDGRYNVANIRPADGVFDGASRKAAHPRHRRQSLLGYGG